MMARSFGVFALVSFFCLLALHSLISLPPQARPQIAVAQLHPTRAQATAALSLSQLHSARDPVTAASFHSRKHLAPRRKQKPMCAASSHEERLRAQDEALVAGLQGQLIRTLLPPSSHLRGRQIAAWIYLPPDYANSEDRYPVAYILHGAPGSIRDPFVNARVHRVAEDLILQKQVQPMILVGWDGQGPDGLQDSADYLDRKDGSWQMESFLLDELVPFMDTNFRTIARPESRALVGFSAGGYGAANIGLRHPDIFRVMCSHAGFFDPNDDPKIMTHILGPKSALWDDNSPLFQTRDMPDGLRLHFYMDCGRDDSLLHEFQKMEKELRARHVDFEAHIFDGDHNWTFLHTHYYDSLKFCDARWKEMAGGG